MGNDLSATVHPYCKQRYIPQVALNSNASETIVLIKGAGAQLDKLLALDCGAISYPTTNRSMIGGGRDCKGSMIQNN